MRVYPASAFERLGFKVLRDRLRHHSRSTLGVEQADSLRPAASADAVRNELRCVSEWQEALRFDDRIPLDHVLDLGDVLRRAAPEQSFVSPEDLVAVRMVLATLRRVRSYFDRRRDKYPQLAARLERITVLRDVEDRIDEVVEGEGHVRDSASAELKRLRRQIVLTQQRLRETLQSELRKAIGQGYATEDQPTIRNGRMVIPVRAEAKRKVQGFVQDVSATGQTVYIEPSACLELNNEVRELEADERREVERILRVVTDRLRGHLPAMKENQRVLADLDLLQAKAHLSNELDAEVPELDDEGVLDIRAGRNPVLLLHFSRQADQDGREKPREVVPLDVTLGEDYRTLVITGPNAGGKTVAMKTVGLFALMVAHGLPVPADASSRIPFFERLMVDIGDQQSIEEDLSTFSSHVTHLRYMLGRAGDRSLVLIDEAGTGTDPAEGGALAQSVLETLNDRGARTIVTTHHGTLKAFAHDTEGVENGSMEFDQETLRPTYHFQAGLPGSSYAFEIAERIGLPEEVLGRARSLVGEQKVAMEELISTFEARTQTLDHRLVEAERELDEARQERQRYEERRRKLDRQRDEIRQQALEEAERIVNGANARIERTIREIKEAEAEREATRQAREELEAFKEEVGEETHKTESRERERQRHRREREEKQSKAAEKAAERPVQEGEIRKGDRVVLDEGTTEAEVLEIEGDEAVVTMGSMRMRTDLSRLRRVGGPRKQQVTVRQTASPSSTGAGSELAAVQARTRVDLRGQRVSEAIEEVTHLIDDAVAAGLNRVEILHGKGTGALREAIHEYLAGHGEVVDFEDAPWNQGGTGVTYVTLG